ncbi:MAG: hypothetical protein KDI09_00990 [Halioglobus sp.]|nr:hypothetical protein [Halioglobus sp.]
MSNDIPDDAIDPTDTDYINGIAFPQPFGAYATALCATARRQVCILSPALERAAFDNEGLAEALSALARHSRQADIRILVSDVQAIVQRGHRLLALAQRLPSKVRMQRLDEHPQWNGETCVIRDRNGVLALPGHPARTGYYEPESRARAQQHLEVFNTLWNSSVSDPQLRALSL